MSNAWVLLAVVATQKLRFIIEGLGIVFMDTDVMTPKVEPPPYKIYFSSVNMKLMVGEKRTPLRAQNRSVF
jgi:hypothetical protein